MPVASATRPARREARMAPASLLALGPLLKRARRAAHLTQAQLAERAGFSVVYVSMLERGARQPQRTTMDALADALGLSPGERAALDMAAHRSSASHPFDWRAD